MNQNFNSSNNSQKPFKSRKIQARQKQATMEDHLHLRLNNDVQSITNMKLSTHQRSSDCTRHCKNSYSGPQLLQYYSHSQVSCAIKLLPGPKYLYILRCVTRMPKFQQRHLAISPGFLTTQNIVTVRYMLGVTIATPKSSRFFRIFKLQVANCRSAVRVTNRELFLGVLLVLFATVVVRHGDDRQDEVDEVE